MPHRSPGWKLIFITAFILTATAAGLLLWPAGRPSPVPANSLAADKTCGVTIDLTQYDDAALAATLAQLRAGGLLWLRQPVLWSQIEPEPGQFDWAKLDHVLAAVSAGNSQPNAASFKLIAVLHTSPRWARRPGDSLTGPPREPARFGDFARAFAQRYGQQIDHYQIWHEPNLSAGWGQGYIDPIAYTQLLAEAALAIRSTDPQAIIISAALAPTLENGPLNLNELDFLDQLYRLHADQWFEVVAGQPFGFDLDPAAPPSAGALNFRRLELLRQVMLAHGDSDTPVWATAFGWDVLPPDWPGRPSPWRTNPDHPTDPAVQAQRTTAGLALARQNWPWLGPALAVRWDSAGLSADDPARGFALSETPLLAAFCPPAAGPPLATAGRYPATHPSGVFSPGWRTAQTLADIPRQPPQTLTINFDGRRLDLAVNRGDYRGFLWVTIDGRPANALPRDTLGRSYVVLYDPQNQPATVTLAQNLPLGPHQAVIEAEGGWGQWAIAGWTVTNADPATSGPELLLAAALAVASGLGLVWHFFPTLAGLWRWPGWQRLAAVPDPAQVAIIFGLALAFYLAPAGLSLMLLAPLALAIIARPDIGLALIAFSLSFFQAPKQLPVGTYWLTESTLLLAAIGFALREIRPGVMARIRLRWAGLDGAALALLALGLVATLAAPNFGVSMLEWRRLVLGSVGYYFLVRLGRDVGPPPQSAGPTPRWVWRLLDALVAGAVLHAAIVLGLYVGGHQAVAAEGARRALSPVYASPNNLALFLDRVWPLLAVIALLPAAETGRLRRWLYGIGLVLVSAALFLTYSKGALLLGLPAGVAAMALFYLWRQPQPRRRVAGLAVAGLALAAAALIPLSQTARLRAAFDVSPGSTGYFRLKLWQSSLAMLRDHWPLGVGLDNFLYQYRTRYILPSAWQEPNLSHPHNVVLDFATRLGVGGAAIFLWLQSAFWLSAWRLYRRRPAPFVLGLMGSMAVFLSHGLIDNSYFLVDLAFVFFLTAGLVQASLEQL